MAACLKRIAERESTVGAWEYLHADQALAQAQKRDRESPRGPLHGVPIGIKDIIDTADMPTKYGSAIFATHQPDRVKPIPSWNSPRLLMAYAAFFFDVVVSIFSSRLNASRSLGRCR